ncbi:hypothetical protein MTO96_013124 [Rhipicephalus appendiculatus]
MTPIGNELVCVGDDVGSKTSTPVVIGDGELAMASVPTVFENYVTAIDVQVELALWDTAGREHDQLWSLSYPATGVTLMCFSIDSPDFLTLMCFSIDSPDFVTLMCFSIDSPDFVTLMCFSIDSPDFLTLVCFSIDSPDFLKNSSESGRPEVRLFLPQCVHHR